MSDPDIPDTSEPFLSRWSRKKRDAVRKPGSAAAEPGADPGAVDELAEIEADAGPCAPGAATPIAEEEIDLSKLPRVEELTTHSDITGFLDRRVPAVLRNAALGRMWTLDPTIRDFIEVAENQWNWNVPGGAPFYEEMLPGSGAGTLMADATSAISRTVGSAGNVEAPVVSLADADVEIQHQPDVDQANTEHAAAHQDPLSDDTAAGVALGPQTVEPEPELPVARMSGSGDGAMRHSLEPTPPVRRRHGGALPV